MAYKTKIVNWSSYAKDIKLIREKVFICEFRISPEIEFDNNDGNSEHVLLRDNDIPIATGRICENGKISRIAVLMKYRNTDASNKVVKMLLDIARRKGLKEVYIDSDLAEVNDFKNQGFKVAGSVFMESGVAKQPLVCSLSNFKCNKSILH